MDTTNANTGPWEAELGAETPLPAGEAVRIAEGPLEGFEGTIVDRRPTGRYLVQIFPGVYVETDSIGPSNAP